MFKVGDRPVLHLLVLIVALLSVRSCQSADSSDAARSEVLPAGVRIVVAGSKLCNGPATTVYRSAGHDVSVLNCNGVDGAVIQHGRAGQPSFIERSVDLPFRHQGYLQIAALGPATSPILFILDEGDIRLRGPRYAAAYDVRSGLMKSILLDAGPTQTLPQIWTGNRVGPLNAACIAIHWVGSDPNESELQVFGAEYLQSPGSPLDLLNENSVKPVLLSLKWRSDDAVLGCSRESGRFQVAFNRTDPSRKNSPSWFGWTKPMDAGAARMRDAIFHEMMAFERSAYYLPSDPNFAISNGNLRLTQGDYLVVRSGFNSLVIIPKNERPQAVTLDGDQIWAAYDPVEKRGLSLTRVFDGLGSGNSSFSAVDCGGGKCRTSLIARAKQVSVGELFPADAADDGSAACPFLFVPGEGWSLHFPWIDGAPSPIALSPGIYELSCAFVFGSGK